MKNIYDDLNAKINDNLAQDPIYIELNARAESCKAVFDEVEAVAPDIRAIYSSDEEFVKYMCEGSTAQYFEEQIDDDIESYSYKMNKHKYFREKDAAESTAKHIEWLKTQKQQLGAFFADKDLGNRAEQALKAMSTLHKDMIERLHFVTRETIKQHYYTKSVQQIFDAVENNIDVPEHDRLERVIDNEVKKFIAARDYQIPQRSSTLKK